jgi:hypothetical protein
MAFAPETTSFTNVIDTTEPQSSTDFCVICLTSLNKEIILSNKVNIGICGIKDSKVLSSEISNFTYIQTPITPSPKSFSLDTT